MNEKLHCSRNWKNKTLCILWPAASGAAAIVMAALGWPLVFVPWIWQGYSCWENDEEC